MRNDVLRKIERHKSHIFVAVEVALAGRNDRLRLALDKIVHDRQIVRSEIPQHIDVVLEEAQIDPRGIVVIEIAERAFVQQAGESFLPRR